MCSLVGNVIESKVCQLEKVSKLWSQRKGTYDENNIKCGRTFL